MTSLREVFKVTWWFDDLNRRTGKRWTKIHATLDSEETTDQGIRKTLCGASIPWEITRTEFMGRLHSSRDVDCGRCLRSIDRLRDAGEW